VVVGGRATAKPIQLVVFDEFSCISDSSCSGDAGSLGVLQFNGYPAVFGVGFRTNNDVSLVSGMEGQGAT
jgi:hypothetical protein